MLPIEIITKYGHDFLFLSIDDAGSARYHPSLGSPNGYFPRNEVTTGMLTLQAFAIRGYGDLSPVHTGLNFGVSLNNACSPQSILQKMLPLILTLFGTPPPKNQDDISTHKSNKLNLSGSDKEGVGTYSPLPPLDQSILS